MASDAQIEANRRNGALGGPKTQEGKDRSRYNATTHGMAYKRLLLWNEDPAEFDALRAGLRGVSPNADAQELMLIENLAYAQWHNMRMPAFEVGLLKVHLQAFMKGSGIADVETADEKGIDQDAGMAILLAMKGGHEGADFNMFLRYKAEAERSYHKALTALEKYRNDKARRELQQGRAESERVRSEAKRTRHERTMAYNRFHPPAPPQPIAKPAVAASTPPLPESGAA